MPADNPLIVRLAWTVLGLGAVGIGGIGIVVPGLPSTVSWASYTVANPPTARRLC